MPVKTLAKKGGSRRVATWRKSRTAGTSKSFRVSIFRMSRFGEDRRLLFVPIAGIDEIADIDFKAVNAKGAAKKALAEYERKYPDEPLDIMHFVVSGNNIGDDTSLFDVRWKPVGQPGDGEHVPEIDLVFTIKFNGIAENVQSASDVANIGIVYRKM